MQGMFQSCHNLINIDLSNFDLSNVSNMEGIFNECYNFYKFKGIENFIRASYKYTS